MSLSFQLKAESLWVMQHKKTIIEWFRLEGTLKTTYFQPQFAENPSKIYAYSVSSGGLEPALQSKRLNVISGYLCKLKCFEQYLILQ